MRTVNCLSDGKSTRAAFESDKKRGRRFSPPASRAIILSAKKLSLLDEPLDAGVVQCRQGQYRQGSPETDGFAGDSQSFHLKEGRADKDDRKEPESDEEKFTKIESFHVRIRVLSVFERSSGYSCDALIFFCFCGPAI